MEEVKGEQELGLELLFGGQLVHGVEIGIGEYDFVQNVPVQNVRLAFKQLGCMVEGCEGKAKYYDEQDDEVIFLCSDHKPKALNNSQPKTK